MEKFEFEGEKKLELFGGFIGRAKDAFTSLIDDIKNNIKDYEQKIEDTSKEISDNETSREKCVQEIAKMEDKIDTIKDAIENVENTYKKIADAYSSTSKGETKELYSEIIDNARVNCEKDVEKNRSEIAHLNSDIEAIKNNIAEFTKIIDELNNDLENYSTELFRYNKSLEQLDKTFEKVNVDLVEISNEKLPAKKTETKTKSTAKKAATRSSKTVEETPEKEVVPPKKVEEKKPSLLDSIEPESFSNVGTEEEKSTKAPEVSFEESLKQIYDLTGYNPNKKEEKTEEPAPKVEKSEAPVYTENLENLFGAALETEPKKETKKENDMSDTLSFLTSDINNWESILNTPNANENKEESSVKSIADNIESTLNELLTPYGTSYARLKSLVKDEVTYKDGTTLKFDMTAEDVIRAVNEVDGNDLKKMKTVGPEITLLRKIKKMKEGNR